VGAPEVVDEPIGRDDLVRPRQQQGEQRPLTLASEGERPFAIDGLQGAKDPELHRSAGSQWLLIPPAHVLTDRSDPRRAEGETMTTRIHTKIAKTLLAAAVIAAVVVPRA